MYCSKCGKENNEGAKFCCGCGAPLTQEFVNNAPNEAPVNGTWVQNPTEAPMMQGGNFAPYPAQNISPKKKNGGKKIAAIIAAVLALVLIVGGVFTALSFQKIVRAVIGETEYYLYQESKNINNIFSFDNLSELSKADSFSADVKLSIDDSQLLSDIFFGEIPADFFEAFKLNADIDYDNSKNIVSVKSSLTNDSDELFDISIGYIDDKLVVSSDLTDESLVINPAELFEDVFDAEIDDLNSDSLSELLSAITQSDILKSLKNVLDNEINKKCIAERGSEEYNGKKCDFTTFEITGEQMDKILVSVLETIRSDESLMSALDVYIYQIFKSAYNDWIGSVYDIFDNLIEEASRYGLAKDEFEKLTFTVYYDSKGNIVSRHISLFDNDGDKAVTILIDSEINEKNADVNITITDHYWNEDVTIDLSKSINDDKLNFSVDVSYDIDTGYGQLTELFKFDASDIEVTKINGVPVLCGNLNAKLREGYSSLEDVFNFSISANENDDDYSIKLNFGVDEYNLSLNILSALSTSPDVSDVEIPSDYTTNFYDYFDEFAYVIEDELYSYIMEYLGYDDYFDYFFGYDDYYDFDDYFDDYSDYFGDYSDYFGDYSDYFGDYSDYFGDYSDYFGDYSDYFGDYSDFFDDYSDYFNDYFADYSDYDI